MTKITSPQALYSAHAWKKFGSPNGFGQIVFGFSYFGEDNIFAGIYQRRPSKNGVCVAKLPFYRPPVSRTEDQSVMRDLFAEAVLVWQWYSPQIKEDFRTEAKKHNRTGYNYFLSVYLKLHS